MILALYRLIGVLAWPVIRLYLARRRALGKEDPARFSERLGIPGLVRPPGPLVWLHGASVGEGLSLLALVERLLAEHPGLHALVTTGTVTSAKLMTDRLPARAFHQYVPVDSPISVKPFLRHWQPDLVLWAESELWPVLVSETRKRATPMILINGRMSPRSFRRWQKHPDLAARLLGCFSLCLVQAETDAERFYKLGATTVRAAGNLKFAAAPLPTDDHARAALETEIGIRPRWLAASTHAGEEAIAARAHQTLKPKHPNLLTVIAPRHPARAEAVMAELDGMGLVIARRSRGEAVTPETDIYLADTIGEMGTLYRLCDIAFLGKSLTGAGGQNPIEAARLKTAILTGPNLDNFEDVTRVLKRTGAVEIVNDERALAAALDTLLADKKTRTHRMEAGYTAVIREAHVLDRIMTEIEPHLAPLRRRP